MSQQLDLISMPVAVQKMPSEPILRSAEISGDMRFTLRRAWGPGPTILWCGLNPSNADGQRDDPTMLREIGFSYRWGYGSLTKVNIYPYITSQPKILKKWLKHGDGSMNWMENTTRVLKEIDRADTIVAAWGAGVERDTVDDFMISMFWDRKDEPKWKCLGMNADGSPIHTLARGVHRVKDDAKLIDWRYDMPEDNH